MRSPEGVAYLAIRGRVGQVASLLLMGKPRKIRPRRGASDESLGDSLYRAFFGHHRDERVNIFGFVPKVEKQRVRQLHAAERTAAATEALAKAEVQTAPLAPNAPAPVPSVTDEIARLASLHSAGQLTDDEFATLKARVIGRGAASLQASICSCGFQKAGRIPSSLCPVHKGA